MMNCSLSFFLYRRSTRLHCRAFSGIDKIVEDKINAWIRGGGAEKLTGPSSMLGGDRHKYMASVLGVGHDYMHSKILADNNIKPKSIQLRLEMDATWEKLRGEIWADYSVWLEREGTRTSCDTQKIPTKELYASLSATKSKFEIRISNLNEIAKECNTAILSDSMRFNGRCPVRHARPFHFQERIMEAIASQEDTK